MTTRISDVIRGWLGWCPSAQMMNRPLPARTLPPVILQPAGPGRATGGGRSSRGLGIAFGSFRLLFRNLRLLVFSIFSGILTVISLVTSLSIQMMAGSNPLLGSGLVPGSLPFLITKGSFTWIGLVFGSTFIISFFTNCVLAGLIACISLILSGKAATFTEGMARAGDHIGPLAAWAAISAVIGTVLSFVTGEQAAAIVPVYLLVIAASVIFFLLTMFVVPAVVLNNEGIARAFRLSVSVFRKVWVETVVCFGVFFLIAFIIILTSLVPMIAIGFSSGSTEVVGTIVLLYMLVMLCIMFIGSTLVGIATFGLYTWGTTGSLDTVYLSKPEMAEPS